MDQNDHDNPRRVPGKHSCWKTPDEAFTVVERAIAQVMNIGNYASVQMLVHQVRDDALQGVAMHAQAGQIGERSWVYCQFIKGTEAVS